MKHLPQARAGIARPKSSATILSDALRPIAALRWLVAGALTLSLTACLTPPWQQLPPSGASQAEVQAQLGKPREVYPLAPGVTRWLYPTKPFGEETIAADFDAQGRLLGTTQVLSTQEFNKVEIDKWTKTDILHHFGEPVETSYFPLMKREVWSYRFKQDDVWFSLMHFYFDAEGVVKTTQISPDPLHEKRDNNLF
ncbi:lipoprotein [Pandoraea horticolens]|uniref:Lipoprotein n=1 Tax=Pandoraea horticolens TaxID=2508298 RepID=A0A5E4WNZ8_9BURK|nr:hypothetical protein [Pandoraea horticolens]VVE25893.1 lipoprotein [Pandoraea horticolens]